MLQGLINRAQRAIDTLVSKYVTRVAVAVPFVIALGFGTAAATVLLSEAYGSMAGYAIMAAIYATIGLVAAVAIASNTPPEPTPVVEVESMSSSDGRMNDQNSFSTPDLLLAALATAGPAAMPAVLRTLLRVLLKNAPLILAASLMAYLLFSERDETAPAAERAPVL